MNYLKYVEHTAENLQFFMWYRDYCTRFEQLPESEKVLSPVWTKAQMDAEAAGAQSTRPKRVNPAVAEVLKGTDFAEGTPMAAEADKKDPFNTPPKTPSLYEKRDAMSSEYASTYGDEKTLASTMANSNRADEAFDDAGMKWKPCKPHYEYFAYLFDTADMCHSYRAALP